MSDDIGPRVSAVKRWLAKVYLVVTPDSLLLAWVGAVAIPCSFVIASTFLMGVVNGASAAVSGESITPIIAEISAINGELWAEFENSSDAARAAIGLFYWLLVLAVEASIVGVHVGYTLPALGHAVDWVTYALLAGFLGLMAAYLIRIIEVLGPVEIAERGTP